MIKSEDDCTSEYFGVRYRPDRKKYIAHIQINNKMIHIGYFVNELDAANAYDKMVESNGLTDRRLNFPPPEPENDIPNTRLIRLTLGQFAIVDESDFERVNQFKWVACKGKATYYAQRHACVNGVDTTQKMHRFIMGESEFDVDHQNCNGLHNYKSNLRFCTQPQNMMNKTAYKNCSSKYKGVTFRQKNNCFQVRISIGKKTMQIGTYSNEIDAAKAYDQNAKERFGKFAKLNFPD